MKVCITGTPCTGKTIVSKKLSERLGWKLISVNGLAKELNAYLGEDKKRNAKILNMRKVETYLEKIKDNIIIEGHTSHEIPCDIVIVLRCNPEVLEKRLKEKYSDYYEKVKENVDAEILGVITSDAIKCNEKVYEVDTSKKSVEQNVDDIENILDGKIVDYEIGLIDWLGKYEEKLI